MASSSSSSSGPGPKPQPPEVIPDPPQCESSNSGSGSQMDHALIDGGGGGGDNSCGCDSTDGQSGDGRSRFPIRYFNGEIMHASSDLSAGGFGMPWGHRRVHCNQLESNYNYGNGYNWMVQQWGHLLDVQDNGDEIVAVLSSQKSCWFDYDSPTSKYNARHGVLEELHTSANVFELCQSDGTVYTFHDFNQTNAGLLDKVTAPGGAVLTISYDSDKRVSEVSRSHASTTESFLYAYIDDALDDNDGMMESVLWRKKVGAGSWENIERCRYVYYEDGDAHGLVGDLEQAIRESWDGSWGNAQTT